MNRTEQRIQEFKEHLSENERSQNTIDSYSTSVNIFFSKYQEVSKENMLAFKTWQMEKWKPKTVHNRIVAMNQFCQFIGHPEYCVKAVKIQKSHSVENVITIEEYQRLLHGLKRDKNEKGYWMIKYLAKTGARVSEFIRLKKDSLSSGYCDMWTKGKIRRIYIPQQLIEESREYFDNVSSDLLFPTKSGKMYTTRGLATNIKKWAEKYGIREEVAHPHSFRHLYAIEFLKRNKNLTLLKDLMGHESIETTAIYLQLPAEEQKRQLDDAMNW